MDDATIAPASKYAAHTEWGLKSLKDQVYRTKGPSHLGQGRSRPAVGKYRTNFWSFQDTHFLGKSSHLTAPTCKPSQCGRREAETLRCTSPCVPAGALPEAVPGTSGLEGINEDKCDAADPFLYLQRPVTDTSLFLLYPSGVWLSVG